MAKQTGIPSKLWIDDVDVSGDIGVVNTIGSSRAQLDVTSIQADYMERLPGIGDATLSFSSFFNSDGAHAELRAMATANKVVTVSLGTAIGAPASTMIGPEVTYNTVRGADGSLVSTTEVVSNNGQGNEWGALGANGSFAAAGSAATLDGAAATSTGAAAVLHLTSIGSGTATFKVQDSADDSSYADVTGLAFTAASAGTAQRVETAAGATLKRYTKVVATGTFGTAVVAVNIIRGL
jgi:hypothetical protein